MNCQPITLNPLFFVVCSAFNNTPQNHSIMWYGASDINLCELPTYQKGFHYEEKVEKMIYKPFGNTGMCTSLLGLGGGSVGTHFNEDREREAIRTILEAVRSGVNYIDTAPYYAQGKSEIIIGKALKGIPRDAYYLATKVGRYGPNAFDFSSQRTEESVQESLRRLGVRHLDVLQVHDLEFAPSIDVVLKETLPTLHRMKEAGVTRCVGITGYPLAKLREVLEKSCVPIDVVLSYCRCTLFDDALLDYIPCFKDKKAAIVNAASLGMGLLTPRGPPEWHPASPPLRKACQEVAQYCEDRNVDVSKLALCHALSLAKEVPVHLIGMENENLLHANLESLRKGLSEHEIAVKEEVMKQLSRLKEKHWEDVEVSKYRKALCRATL